MADKEEVEPTEESAAAGASDAAGPTDPSAPRDPSAPLDPQDAVAGHDPDAADDDSRTEPDGDDFDEIVRGSGLQSPSGTDDDPDDTSDAEPALEPAGVGAAAAGASAGAVVERSAGRKPKEVATKRRDQPAKPERTGPVKFVRESVGELRKVVYPTGQQLVNYFVVVLVFVLFVIAYVSVLDLGLGKAIFALFS